MNRKDKPAFLNQARMMNSILRTDAFIVYGWKTMRLLRTILLTAAGSFLAVNTAFTQPTNWVQTSAPVLPWRSVASSADGSKLFALADDGGSTFSKLYISTNGGANWISNNIRRAFGYLSIASSADGNKLAAAATYPGGDGLVVISTNGGATWNWPGFFFPNDQQAWAHVAMSADGTKLVASAVQGTGVWTSTNSGTTWMKTDLMVPPNYDLYPDGLAVSSDGNRMTVAAKYGRLFTSADAGATWVSNNIGDYSFNIRRALASSADGSKLIMGLGWQGGGALYQSTNSGATWTSNDLNEVWNSVASSADGVKLIAGIDYTADGIFTSTDSGVTWTSTILTNSISNRWSVACSADGCKFVATVLRGCIYTCQTTPTPQLNVMPTNGSLAFSWLMPSTNFFLQQNQDLAAGGWVTLTNTPTLNCTNLNCQLSIAPTNASGFFRLSTPP
jgi:hypothetical protein